MDSRILFWTQVILLVSTGSGILGQSPGDVRLVGGSSTLEGRVEVYYDNVWGTICNRGWDSTDSGVVCRQLGFQVSLSSPSFGPGIPTQRIWLADVKCESSDRRLNECVTDDQWGQTSTCPHENDVGVRCSGLNVGIAPNYQGCYRFGDIPVSNTAIQFPSNTIEACLESCSINFMFAGLYGETCTCDDQINPSAQPIDNTMCKMPCPGNSAQLCGDAEVNMEVLSVYSVSVGDGYVSSPWFPGNYVLSSTDTSQPDDLISSTDVTASSGMLLIRVLAFDLAPGDTLSVEVGGMTINPTESGETMLSGLLEMTLVVTATLTRAANSAGASGYLITFTRDPTTTMPQTTPTIISAIPMTNQPEVTSSPAVPVPPVSPDPNSTATPPDEVTTAAVVPATPPPPTDEATDPAMTTAPVTIPPNPSTCDHPVVEEGRIVGVDGSPYQVGQSVVLDCDDGRNPVENTTLSCQSDRTWFPLPTCTASGGIEVWMIIVIAVVISLCLVILIVIFLIMAVAFGKKKKRREDDRGPVITHLATPTDNDYSGRPALIPINEASASGLVRQGTNVSTASTLGIPPPPPPAATTQSTDAVQQTEPIILPPPPSQPAPDPPSPTETYYPPVDYPGSANRDSVISGGNLGNEERQAVDEIVNAVRDYDDSPGVGLYGSVPPRHLRSGSTLSVISNPGRVTDGRSSPRYGGNLRSVQFDQHNYRP
ncbi:uncharacterized protein LOC115923370 [Strongylocentrotus purpuratus]|uniref:Uncharacterized protein n=1 Tax=Strongylocentrotus purpuratus TaxID=7668 RepID=A0A7M7NPH5_STRPU|nr:uncharacterized protein LOC115923370 [Strongylocentrotus purpuratus]